MNGQRFPGIFSILRNGLMLSGTDWMETGLRALYAILIARLLGPELYGVWSYSTTTYAFVIAFTFFGLDALIPLRLGKDRAASKFLATTLLLRLALLVVAAGCLVLYATFAETDPRSQIALFLLVPALIGRGVVLWARTVFLGLEQSETALRFAVSVRFLEICIGLALLWFGFGLLPIVSLHAVSWVVEALWAVRTIHRRIPIPPVCDPEELKPLLREGAVLGLNAAGLAALTATPIIFTRYLTDDLQVVGQMALAIQLASLTVMGVQGILSAALPVLSRAADRNDARLDRYPWIVAVMTTAIFAVAGLVAIWIGPPVVGFLMGNAFLLAGELLAPALLVGGLSMIPVGYWQKLMIRKQIWCGVLSSWVGTGVLIASIVPFVESAGAFGAFAAAALAWTSRAAILIFHGRRNTFANP